MAGAHNDAADTRLRAIDEPILVVIDYEPSGDMDDDHEPSGEVPSGDMDVDHAALLSDGRNLRGLRRAPSGQAGMPSGESPSGPLPVAGTPIQFGPAPVPDMEHVPGVPDWRSRARLVVNALREEMTCVPRSTSWALTYIPRGTWLAIALLKGNFTDAEFAEYASSDGPRAMLTIQHGNAVELQEHVLRAIGLEPELGGYKLTERQYVSHMLIFPMLCEHPLRGETLMLAERCVYDMINRDGLPVLTVPSPF